MSSTKKIELLKVDSSTAAILDAVSISFTEYTLTDFIVRMCCLDAIRLMRLQMQFAILLEIS